MACFVNLPLSWVAQDAQWLDWFLAERICPELGLDEASLLLPRAWHQDIARRLQAAGLACAVHLPFMGLEPGSVDRGQRARAQEQLALAAELSKMYGAAHMVGHPGFVAARDGKGGSELLPDPAWLERVCETWSPISALAEAPLFLENIYDLTPQIVLSVLAALNLPAASIGVCFDAGHWNYFSGGKARQDLPDWVRAYAPHLRHLHLHDNDGSSDQHLGLGQGNIPFTLLLQLLDEFGVQPSVTFEPHTRQAFMDTAAWFAARPAAAAQIGWRPLGGSALAAPQEL